jgi:hypothetical protein
VFACDARDVVGEAVGRDLYNLCVSGVVDNRRGLFANESERDGFGFWNVRGVTTSSRLKKN